MDSTERKSQIVWTTVVMFAVAAAYTSALRNGFIYDDVGLIVNRAAHFKTWDGLWNLITHGYWWNVPEATAKTYVFRPWLTATFWISAQFGGMNPLAFHLVNTLAQMAVTGCLVLLFTPLLGFRPAIVLAALSGLSPSALSSVGMITCASDVWALLFTLIFLILFRGYRKTGLRWKLFAANAALFFALASKEIAVIAPVLAWLFEYFEPGDKARKIAWKNYATLLIPLVVFWLWRHQAIQSAGSDRVNLQFATGMFPYLAEKIVRSVGHVVLPIHYALYSEYAWSLPGQRGLPFGLAWITVIGVLVLLIVGFRKRALWALGGLWFLVVVLPVFVFGQGFAPLSDFYVYGGIPGLWLFVYCGAAAIARSRHINEQRFTAVAAYAAGGLALIFAVLTFLRLPILRSEYSLSEHMANREPKSVMALTRMADACVQAGQQAQAIQYFERLVQIEPVAVDAQKYLADYYLDSGDARKAAPNVDALAEYAPNDIDCQGTVANFYYVAGHCPEAVQTYTRAMALGTPSPQFLFNYGLALLCVQDNSKALALYQTLTRHHPKWAEAYQTLGMSWQRLDSLQQAATAYQTAVQLDSKLAMSWQSLALVNLQLGNRTAAEQAADQFYALHPSPEQADSLRIRFR
jgi:tetratricopeptide (TPR) repeat protein